MSKKYNYSITLLKNKHSDVLSSLLNSKSSEIPMFSQGAIEESRELLKAILQELRALMKIQKQENLPEHDILRVWRRVKTGTLFDDYARVKRFLLIYLSNRLNKIEYHFWNFGGLIKDTQQKNVADHEKNYLVEYKKLLLNYSNSMGVDIMSDIDPPFEIYTEVKVIKDHDDILNENGDVIKLSKGTIQYLQSSLVQHLLAQGYLIRV